MKRRTHGHRSKKQLSSRAHGKLRRGNSASTAAGEYVHEELRHVRSGKHGAKNAGQAVAIGLSKARRAGIPVKKKH